MKPLQAMGERIRPICDRFWLFSIAGLSLGIIGFVAGSIVINGKMPAGAGELFSAMITGLMLIVQKVIEAQQTRQTMQQLHESSPAKVGATPADAQAAADQVADAAADKADEIAGEGK
jgi:hypothetical protein